MGKTWFFDELGTFLMLFTCFLGLFGVYDLFNWRNWRIWPCYGIFLAFSGIITHLKICETVPLAGHTKVKKKPNCFDTKPSNSAFLQRSNCSIEFFVCYHWIIETYFCIFFTAPQSFVYCMYLLVYSMILIHPFLCRLTNILR